MTAQTLRDAAKVLRERAENATPQDLGLLDYILLMGPAVGLALADWLDEEAARIAAAASEGADARPYEPALRAAEAILGGDA